ncbi:MAG TPA: SDR family NAD(P)-dependent oxidoreductase [Bdellovibrio sp.]|uniref:SDR family NAD(P)-dependent oxidoreductase n=1 Tax=Bdellovibrio sp. TaxID=28201 RepID=UPI002EF307C1
MSAEKTALIVGASRGLGFSLAQEFLKRGWKVVGTVRGNKPTKLHELANQAKGMLEIESVDITNVDQIIALKAHLKNKTFDLLFVNAGVANARYETIGEVSTEEFTRVMVTNALSVMRVVEQLADNVIPGGTIGVMSSGQGSVADNETGGFEVYRASKAALNTLMRSFAARRAQDRSLVLMAPGWIKTDMGGPEAKFTVEETIPNIVDTIIAQEGKKGSSPFMVGDSESKMKA